MNRPIEYRTELTGLTPADLGGFFEGWPDPPSPERHLRILRGSAHVVLAVDGEGGKVVGFINAIADGELSAFIPLLEVLPPYRKAGVGTELVRRMRALLDGYYSIDLVCDEHLARWYASLGFTAGCGMMLRNRRIHTTA